MREKTNDKVAQSFVKPDDVFDEARVRKSKIVCKIHTYGVSDPRRSFPDYDATFQRELRATVHILNLKLNGSRNGNSCADKLDKER